MTHTADSPWYPRTCTTCTNQVWPCAAERQRLARIRDMHQAYRRRRK